MIEREPNPTKAEEEEECGRGLDSTFEVDSNRVCYVLKLQKTTSLVVQ